MNAASPPVLLIGYIWGLKSPPCPDLRGGGIICGVVVGSRVVDLDRQVGSGQLTSGKSHTNGRTDGIDEDGQILTGPRYNDIFNHSLIPPRAGACLTFIR